MSQLPKTSSTTDTTSTQIPKFEFGLTSSVLINHLQDHGLTSQQIVIGRFKVQNTTLGSDFFLEDLTQDAFPRGIPDTAKSAITAFIQSIDEWPNKMDWQTFIAKINNLLNHWVVCYLAETPIRTGFRLINLIEFKLGIFTKPSHQFQLLLHDLIAESTTQYERYRFQYMQTHDTVSGLANLKVLESHLTRLFNNDNKLVGLLIIRMTIAASKNNARAIANTTVIKEISHIIRSYLTPGQLLFQIRRDEFAISISHLDTPVALNLMATKLTRILDVALHTERKVHEMSTIMAGCSFSDQTENLANIYHYAKLTLEDAISNGNSIAMYHPDIKERAELYKQLERDVVAGFEANNFELFLQPVVNIQLGKCFNAEALLRWKNANGNYVAPPTIIEIIYQQGLGLPFMRWLVSTACRISSEIHAKLGYALKIAINLTADDLLDRDLPHLIMQQMSIWDVKPEDLTLEITETGLLADETLVENNMRELIKIGCPMAIDDFGTGYSSMSRLRNMPVSSVKIDQSFVRNLAESNIDKTIVQSITTLAQGLNKETVAEGVEDLACLEIIKSMGCTKVQGYFYSKPLPANECIEWVRNFNETPH